MTQTHETLKTWLAAVVEHIEKQGDIPFHHDNYFLQDPHRGLELVELYAAIDEKTTDDEDIYYRACIFSMDLCVAELHMATEFGNKSAAKSLDALMERLAQAIQKGTHTLGFWLPILNAFYEVHADLSPALKDAYYNLAYDEAEHSEDLGEENHLQSIRELIAELSDLSDFEIAEHFFSQSYAMPAEFFADLVIDLYNIDEGKDIALLMLLHPNAETRAMIMHIHDQIIHSIELSSIALSRLQTIKYWYPPQNHERFDYWIRVQRKKGVVFHPDIKAPAAKLTASEVDGGGAQGIFIHIHKKQQYQLAGLLLKQDMGIKEAWMTPIMSLEEINKYLHEAFEDKLSVRNINYEYMHCIITHFLAISVEQGHIPGLHVLEIQEKLGQHWKPAKMDIGFELEQLAIQISPFTTSSLQDSLKRSKTWIKNKSFTTSWYEEHPLIDKLVNHSSTYIEGMKVCRYEEATKAILSDIMEQHREQWTFHFLWVTFWLKAVARKNEKTWHDSFFIAYALHTGMPMHNIPLLKEIAYQSVINSMETMQERKTHLNQE